MTRLATILIGAWVLWVEGFDLTSQTTVYAPKPLGAYPTKGDEACMAEARRLITAYADRTHVKTVSRGSSGSREVVAIELESGELYSRTYLCLPENIDPRTTR
jgi:hypothetical protein